MGQLDPCLVHMHTQKRIEMETKKRERERQKGGERHKNGRIEIRSGPDKPNQRKVSS